MHICKDEIEAFDISPLENIQCDQQASAIDAGLVNELVARCDYYLALYVQQVSTNQKLILLQQETAEKEKNAVSNIQQEPSNAMADLPAEKEKNGELEQILKELIIRNDNFAAVLAEKEKQIAFQNIRISQLGAQNMKYRQQIERIKSKWYGRLLVWCYHFCCRVGILRAL